MTKGKKKEIERKKKRNRNDSFKKKKQKQFLQQVQWSCLATCSLTVAYSKILSIWANKALQGAYGKPQEEDHSTDL